MNRQQLIEQLKRHEGFRQHPYKDTVGKLTVGYGRNLDDRGITRKEAEVLMINDLTQIENVLANMVPWFLTMNSARQDALINMAFNLGILGLFTFKNMLRAMENGDYKRAAAEALDSKWSMQVGPRAQELAEQIRTGVYAGGQEEIQPG